jgi:hypothetical protein
MCGLKQSLTAHVLAMLQETIRQQEWKIERLTKDNRALEASNCELRAQLEALKEENLQVGSLVTGRRPPLTTSHSAADYAATSVATQSPVVMLQHCHARMLVLCACLVYSMSDTAVCPGTAMASAVPLSQFASHRE